MRVLLFLFGLAMGGVFAGEWNRQKAFDFLEDRQRQWAEWKPAQKAGGACVSCHTGLSYLVARRVAAEKQPLPQEKALLDGVRSRVLANPPGTMLANEGAEAILNLLTLALPRRSRTEAMGEADKLAWERLWTKQNKDGGWPWFQFDLHPVESEHSLFYAAAVAELAVSAYPEEKSDRVAAMRAYLRRESAGQPLHNRLAWVAFGKTLAHEEKASVWKELWAKQSEDGGFTNAALGPWAKHADAPAAEGSNAYATAWAAYAARESGVSCAEPGLRRALDWLRQRQDRATGAWKAVSMNKVYPAGSIQEGFMTDAASGWALAALIACDSR